MPTGGANVEHVASALQPIVSGVQAVGEVAGTVSHDAASQPLLAPAGIQESMSDYFARLSKAVDLAAFKSCRELDLGPGLYLYKRPVFSAAGAANPLAACGTVYHHCILFIKEAGGGRVHSLDFGPVGGADVTANLLAAVPARGCLALDVQPPHELAGASGAGNLLPYLYLGPLAMPLDDERVVKAIKVAESRPYHAIRNNCVHFADAAARLLTGGRMAMQLSWLSVCEGSPLYRDMVASDMHAAPPGQGPGAPNSLAALQRGAAMPPDPAAAAMQLLAAFAAQQAPAAAAAAATLAGGGIPQDTVAIDGV